jgi:hypothetical protein
MVVKQERMAFRKVLVSPRHFKTGSSQNTSIKSGKNKNSGNIGNRQTCFRTGKVDSWILLWL